MAYPTLLEHIRSACGPNWCVAPRRSRRTARYDHVITPLRYERLCEAWVQSHPAFRLALTLPEGDDKRLVCSAVLDRLRRG